VRRHPVEDGVGGEDPPEVVGPERERLPVGAGDAGCGEGAVEVAADPADDRGQDVGQFRVDDEERSWSVLDGATDSSGTSSPVEGSRYCTRL
jgi:hypothetical protein